MGGAGSFLFAGRRVETEGKKLLQFRLIWRRASGDRQRTAEGKQEAAVRCASGDNQYLKVCQKHLLGIMDGVLL